MNLPANPGRPQLTERLVVDLGAAFQQRAVYAAGHPQVQRAVTRALDAFAAWCRHEGTSEVSLLTLEGQLLVDRQAIPEDSPWARGLLQTYRRYEIGGLTLLAGLDAEGDRSLRRVAGGETGSADQNVGRRRRALRRLAALEEPAQLLGVAARVAPRWLTAEQMAEARAELVAAATGRASRIDRLRALVARLARSAETGALGPLDLTPADSDDRAFLHGLAVALASLRLGRALGLAGEPLEELGELCRGGREKLALLPEQGVARRRELERPGLGEHGADGGAGRGSGSGRASAAIPSSSPRDCTRRRGRTGERASPLGQPFARQSERRQRRVQSRAMAGDRLDGLFSNLFRDLAIAWRALSSPSRATACFGSTARQRR